jgi:hypothetical protein
VSEVGAALEPVRSASGLVRRRQSRLLATFLCLLFVVFGVVDVVSVLWQPHYVPLPEPLSA